MEPHLYLRQYLRPALTTTLRQIVCYPASVLGSLMSWNSFCIVTYYVLCHLQSVPQITLTCRLQQFTAWSLVFSQIPTLNQLQHRLHFHSHLPASLPNHLDFWNGITSNSPGPAQSCLSLFTHLHLQTSKLQEKLTGTISAKPQFGIAVTLLSSVAKFLTSGLSFSLSHQRHVLTPGAL